VTKRDRPSTEAPAQAAEGATQMIHRPAPSQPRPAIRGITRTRRTLTTLSGLAVLLTAAIGLAPAASAIRLPPPGGGGAPPPPPPPATAAAHFPLWAVIAIVAATVVLSVATTLVTLSLDHMHQAHRTPATTPEFQAGHTAPSTAAELGAEQGDIVSSHQHVAGHDMYRPGSS
jgi:hypothetical protein